MKIVIKLKKPRNPYHKDLTLLGRKIVVAKKGKGAYNRKRWRGEDNG